MERYDFDAPVDRRGSHSMKFDAAAAMGKREGLLSMWVADMDFTVPPAVVEALHQRVDHAVFGYTNPWDGYRDAVVSWMARYGWQVSPNWIVPTPGVVFALAMAVRAFTEPGDAVVIQRPVYYPFTNVIERNGRRVANAPLVYQEGAYRIDFDALEQTIQESGAKLFLLCNPHNPSGRLWTRDELARIAEIALRNDVIVVSDEIHMDFVRPGYEHTVFATLDDRIAQRCVVCTAASKTFNLAGLETSNIIIPNGELRRAFKDAMHATGTNRPNVLGLVATEACYRQGAEWLAQLKEYLEGNWALVESHLREHAPQLHLVPAQSTYLAWVDCRELGLYGEDLRALIEDEAGLWLDLGDMFGPEGDGFIRLNLATQRATVQRALTQLTDAIARM
ncbi:MalY/PatB family protein [Denitrobacterium detoxificans]|jgi:cystathionine beta-lyase|uniref:MalY/PatB family protein n=1 Tax=Denitrobacterium detoxificans TaxID=79604 RepID=UPI0026E9FB6E|nr:MalY/PatB family protein [Denitrobacterium detoxificans]MBE6465793.1 pyridoxal phosphate-dependent aminotransferase [Denitrobacterium detoxificans]